MVFPRLMEYVHPFRSVLGSRTAVQINFEMHESFSTSWDFKPSDSSFELFMSLVQQRLFFFID